MNTTSRFLSSRFVACCAAMVFSALVAFAVGAQPNDADFVAARDAYRAGDAMRLERIAPRLKGHLLEPYVGCWRRDCSRRTTSGRASAWRTRLVTSALQLTLPPCSRSPSDLRRAISTASIVIHSRRLAKATSASHRRRDASLHCMRSTELPRTTPLPHVRHGRSGAHGCPKRTG